MGLICRTMHELQKKSEKGNKTTGAKCTRVQKCIKEKTLGNQDGSSGENESKLAKREKLLWHN